MDILVIHSLYSIYIFPRYIFFLDPGVVPRRVLPRRVIAPHRRWMPRKQSSRQRNKLPGNTVLYNQAHRGVPGMQQPIRPHSTSARAPGRYSRDTATRPPCWPPTPDQTVRGFKFLFWCSSGELHLCTTSWWGDPYGDRTGGPTPRRCREARHIPLRDLFYPDMLP